MKRNTLLIFSFSCFLISLQAAAQTDQIALRKANQFYKKGEYEKAKVEYEKAVAANPGNVVAQYNLGTAKFRLNDYAGAEQNFETGISSSADSSFKHQSYYNKGVSLTKQKKLLESIEAYKASLKLNANDEDTRVNLQKALEELRKQQNNNKPKEQEQPKSSKQDKPKPQQTNLDKKKIEQYLKSLQQKEQEVQQKIQQNRSRSASRPEKDW